MHKGQMSLEAGVILDLQGAPLHWHTPLDRTGVLLPDSRDLWDIFWDNRGNLSGFAHSHPSGMVGPSTTDITTFAAVESALGQKLDWWIVTPNEMTLTRWVGRRRAAYKTLKVSQRPLWFKKLLKLSNYL